MQMEVLGALFKYPFFHVCSWFVDFLLIERTICMSWFGPLSVLRLPSTVYTMNIVNNLTKDDSCKLKGLCIFFRLVHC
jgi:hypothetical protein